MTFIWLKADIDVEIGTFGLPHRLFADAPSLRPSALEAWMNGIIYLIGLIVVIMAILSFLGLR